MALALQQQLAVGEGVGVAVPGLRSVHDVSLRLLLSVQSTAWQGRPSPLKLGIQLRPVLLLSLKMSEVLRFKAKVSMVNQRISCNKVNTITSLPQQKMVSKHLTLNGKTLLMSGYK